MRSMSCFCRKRETTSGPKVKETPRSFSLQPVMSLSGSDHNKSHSRPQSGICVRVSSCSQGYNFCRERQCVQRTYVSGPHDTADLLHGVEIRAQATVHGEDLLVDDSGDGKAVEAISESLPKLDVVATLALVVETVDTVDGRALVVAAENEEVLGILDLVGKQKADGLEGLLATINVVTEEEVVGLRGEAAVFEQTQ